MTRSTHFPEHIESFRSLHKSGCFVLPNPWDRGTALFLQSLGFQALATTSAGLGFSLGLPDEIEGIPLESTLQHIREIVQATPLPVNADFQNGFADAPEELVNTVQQCVATGVAGLSIEDATGVTEQPLYERSLAIERMHAAKEAIGETGVFLTGRCEARLIDVDAPLDMILDRLVAYAEAGADCLYAPGIRKEEEMQIIVQTLAPKPVNILMSSADTELTVPRLAAMGVRRISVGSAMARTAWGAFMKSAQGIIEDGSFRGFKEAASFASLNKIFTK